MLDEIKLKSGFDVIYLVSCALHGVVPDRAVVEAMDQEQVYNMAKYHNVQALISFAVEGYTDIIDPQIMNKLQFARTRTVKNILLFASEREKLCRYMDENGIWYLPMKGIIMQDLYPKLGMRQMVDNDMLIDINRRSDVKKYFEENGYKVECFGRDSHDIYMKPPMFNFEMHVYLCTESVNAVIHNYYRNIHQRLIKDEAHECGYRFSPEDFYIHLIFHAYKHYSHGGVGIRVLADIYVYLQRYASELDRAYIEEELNKMGLSELETKLKKLSDMLFGAEPEYLNLRPEKFEVEDMELLGLLIRSGSFGTMGRNLRQKLMESAGERSEVTVGLKFKYFLNRLFPTGLFIKENYPFVYKHKYLLPFFWVYRFFYKMFTRAESIIKEFTFISKQK